MKKYLFFLTSLFLFSFISNPLFATISFENIDINDSDEVLYTINQNEYKGKTYGTLAYTKLQNGSHQVSHEFLTCFPEQMELINNGRILQIRNKYGTAHYDFINHNFEWKNYSKNIPEINVPLTPYSVSNDGKWICYLQQTSDVKASLIIKNVSSGKIKELCADVLMDYEKIPVKWATDSSILFYENAGSIYFCNPDAYFRDIEVDEKNRKIGRGKISSIQIISEKYLAYVDDFLLYKINLKELYTLGLYSGVIGQGKIVGRLPFQFNPESDYFSVNKSFSGIFVVQNDRMFSYLTCKTESCEYMDVVYSKPYTDSKATLSNYNVLWDKKEAPILWLEKLPYDSIHKKGSVYKISTTSLQVLEIEDAGKPFVSPDGSKVAFFAGESIYVYDVTTWSRIGQLPGECVSSVIWLDPNNLIVGGTKSIKKWNTLTNETLVIAMSSCKAGYWNHINGKIVCDNGSGVEYEFDKENKTWSKIGVTSKRNPITQNGRYRVFLGNSINSNFENSIYVRTLTSKPTTKVLYSQTRKKTSPKKKLALVFDAYDNADGLSKVITTLSKYNINSTFFINGEFIRRYPSETKQISIYNFDCASMFFSAIDLTDNEFIIDEDFIRRGLARNEDEFYQLTRKELSLFWHAPFYLKNSKILSAGEKTGYNYVEVLDDIRDLQELSKNQNIQEVLAKYIKIIETKDAVVIPIPLGYSTSLVNTPLYNNLDLLICTLLKKGYEFETINNL